MRVSHSATRGCPSRIKELQARFHDSLTHCPLPAPLSHTCRALSVCPLLSLVAPREPSFKVARHTGSTPLLPCFPLVHPQEIGMSLLLKPSDGPSCGGSIGFIDRKPKGLGQGGLGKDRSSVNLHAPARTGAAIAPAKGRAGAGRFVDGQICQGDCRSRPSGKFIR